jgi:hypothetical protein
MGPSVGAPFLGCFGCFQIADLPSQETVYWRTPNLVIFLDTQSESHGIKVTFWFSKSSRITCTGPARQYSDLYIYILYIYIYILGSVSSKDSPVYSAVCRFRSRCAQVCLLKNRTLIFHVFFCHLLINLATHWNYFQSTNHIVVYCCLHMHVIPRLNHHYGWQIHHSIWVNLWWLL